MPDFAVNTAFRATDGISRSFSRMDKGAQKFGRTAESAFKRADRAGSRFKDVFKGVFAGMSAERLVEGTLGKLKDAFSGGLEYASDLVEVQNVVTQTFGPQGQQQINQWSKTATKSFGLSQLQAKQFASTLGAMMKSSGLAGDKLQGMSMKMSGLAGDLASFYNIPIEQAFQKIQSAIAGQTEPMRELGVNMTVANLQAYALTQGITTQWQKMSSAQQTLLRYQYMMKATADAQGDFSRTLASSYANQKRVLSNKFQQVMGNVMSMVLPLAMKLADRLNVITDRVGSWVDANKELIQTRLDQFIGTVSRGIQFAGKVFRVTIGIVRTWYPVIMAVIGALVLLKTTQKATLAFTVAWKTISAAIEAYQMVTQGAATAQEALNLVMSANPIGLIVTALAILIGITIVVVKHWKEITTWVGNAWSAIKGFAVGVFNTVIPYLQAFGQMLLKWWLLPLNLVIKGVVGLLQIMGKMPGKIGAPFRAAAEAVGGMQDSINKLLTGSAKVAGFGETWKNATAPNKASAPNQAAVDSKGTQFRGDVYYHGMPEGTTVEGETRGAPPVRQHLLGANP